MLRTSNCRLLLIYLLRNDERLSWPGWLTYSGRFTHVSGHPSAVGREQDRESSPVKEQRPIFYHWARNQQVLPIATPMKTANKVTSFLYCTMSLLSSPVWSQSFYVATGIYTAIGRHVVCADKSIPVPTWTRPRAGESIPVRKNGIVRRAGNAIIQMLPRHQII